MSGACVRDRREKQFSRVGTLPKFFGMIARFRFCIAGTPKRKK